MSASTNVVPLKSDGLPLVRYDAMCTAISECYGVDEVMQFRAEASVMAEAYAKIANDTDNERKCREIQRRAERRCGEVLADMEKAKGGGMEGVGRRGNSVAVMPPSQAGALPQRSLADMGISTHQASDWQRLAKVPEPAFERIVSASGSVPSARHIVAQHEAETRAPGVPVLEKVDPMALWLWGHLTEFERNGALHMDPNVLLRTMLDHMRETSQELAPRIAEWLGRIRP